MEVAEQFHRGPLEQIKLKLIESGIFGRVYSSFNDFAGHGYHGISILHGYLGFDAKPLQVTGVVGKYHLAPQWSQLVQELILAIRQSAMEGDWPIRLPLDPDAQLT